MLRAAAAATGSHLGALWFSVQHLIHNHIRTTAVPQQYQSSTTHLEHQEGKGDAHANAELQWCTGVLGSLREVAAAPDKSSSVALKLHAWPGHPSHTVLTCVIAIRPCSGQRLAAASPTKPPSSPPNAVPASRKSGGLWRLRRGDAWWQGVYNMP